MVLFLGCFIVLMVNLLVWFVIYWNDTSYLKQYKEAIMLLCGYAVVSVPLVITLKEFNIL